MTDKPFKFRRVHEIAGGFVVVVLLLAAALVLVTGRVQGWFEKQSFYEVVLPPEGVEGIRAGSEVRILGSRAGRVRAVELRRAGTEERLQRVWEVAPDEIELVAVLEVRGDRSVFVGAESRAVVRKDLAGFGASYVDVTRGSSKRKEGDRRLPLTLEADVTNEVTAIVRELQEAMLPSIKQVEKAYSAVEQLTSVLASPEGDFQKAMSALQEVMTAVNEGEGALGVLLRDRKAAEDLAATLSEMRRSADVLAAVLKDFEQGKGAAGALFRDDGMRERLAATVASTEAAAAGLPAAVRTTNATLGEIRQATQILQQALREYEEVAEAMQRHWLLRRFVEGEDEPAGGAREVERPEADKVNRKYAKKPAGTVATEVSRKPRGVAGPR